MHKTILAAAFGLAALAWSAAPASAHEPGWRYPAYYGGSYGGYYGNGHHDLRPHWHNSYTPYGVYSWYGNGLHDLLPHQHTYTPWGKVGQNYTPWGYTESYYPRYSPYSYGYPYP
jgi:hypothetical protein